jgi:glycerol-3-phosphate acyltransferase PlsY
VTTETAVLLVLAAATGYLLGAVSPATLVAARRGIDLRQVGSGNPGATNVGRALGHRAAATVALLDLLKGLLPAAGFGAADHRAGLLAGLAAVVGHISSPFLRGRGGKGVATAAGAVLGSHPLWGLAVLVVWVLVVALGRWIALASMCAAVAVLVVALAVGEDRVWALLLALVIIGRHQANVARKLARPPSPTDG